MRLDYRTTLPEASQAMSALERVVSSSTLEPPLRELVKLRASQINGCAYCVDMHTKDARAMGEDEQRLHLVSVWREAPSFTDRERAALAWTEALTLLPETGAPDETYEAMAAEFDAAEQVALTVAIIAINGWNRLAVGFRQPVGSYVSHRHPVAAATRPSRSPRPRAPSRAGPSSRRLSSVATWWPSARCRSTSRSRRAGPTAPASSSTSP
jgi:AhpD family alkylhydroperoxidase